MKKLKLPMLKKIGRGHEKKAQGKKAKLLSVQTTQESNRWKDKELFLLKQAEKEIYSFNIRVKGDRGTLLTTPNAPFIIS